MAIGKSGAGTGSVAPGTAPDRCRLFYPKNSLHYTKLHFTLGVQIVENGENISYVLTSSICGAKVQPSSERRRETCLNVLQIASIPVAHARQRMSLFPRPLPAPAPILSASILPCCLPWTTLLRCPFLLFCVCSLFDCWVSLLSCAAIFHDQFGPWRNDLSLFVYFKSAPT